MSELAEEKQVYLIAGLGNPGREYRNTRHNTGFMVLDRLAGRHNQSFTKVESRALVCKFDYQGRRLILAKPQTYMNESGKAIGALAHFYKVPLENILIVYDEVDLPVGILRMRPDGGSAGQKGMVSIIERLGSETFPRLRVGIGRPPGRMEAADYVLRDWSGEEAEILPQILDRAAEAVLAFVTQGIDQAMNLYNGPNDP